MDHAEFAENLLAGIYSNDKTDKILLALAHGILGLCQRWDEMPCLIAHPVEEDEEEE